MSNTLNVKMEGFEELTRAFRELGDSSGKVRKIRAAERKAARIYMTAIKSKAVGVINDSGELSESFGWKHKGNIKRGFVDVSVGAKNRGKKGASNSIRGSWFTYSAQAAIFNQGTEERRTRSGKGTGRIKPSFFIDKTFIRTAGRVKAAQKYYLTQMLRNEVRKAGLPII